MGCCMSSESDQNATGLARATSNDEVDDALRLLGGASLSTPVELSIRCEGLKNSDLMSKSDPFVVVSMRPPGGQWIERGRTEIVANSAAPTFVTRIRLDFRFEETQEVKFDVYDCDSSFKTSDAAKLKLNGQDFLGSTVTTLANIFGCKGSTWMGALGNNAGRIIVIGEERGHNNSEVRFTLKGVNLDNVEGMTGTSDPFIVISRCRDDETTYLPVCKTEVIRNNVRSPQWQPLIATVGQLCGGEPTRTLKLTVYDHNSSGSHTLIGECFTSLDDLERKAGGNMAAVQGAVNVQSSAEFLPIINEEKRRRKGASYVDSGKLYIMNFTITPKPSFVDYLKGGLQLAFIPCIDFTGSNGDPASPSSLHYISRPGYGQQQVLNQYEQAILAVGPVLEHYDTTRNYPSFGFGGSVNGRVSHCFALTGDESNPCVSGIQGVLQAYKAALGRVPLSGPTWFSEIIARAAATAAATPQSSASQTYYVLLIITDGAVTDAERTIEQIVAASDLPLSILIVGVGAADFGMMEKLDGDDAVLQTSSGKKSKRDIVQFVPFRKFQGQPNVGSLIARDLLAELPKQLLTYYTSRGILPAGSTPSPLYSGAGAGVGGATPPPY